MFPVGLILEKMKWVLLFMKFVSKYCDQFLGNVCNTRFFFFVKLDVWEMFIETNLKES